MAIDQREALIAAVRAQVEKEKQEKAAKLKKEQEAMKLAGIAPKKTDAGEDGQHKHKMLSAEELAKIEEKKRRKRAAELGIDQDGTRYNDADIYFLDSEKPLVCVHTTMAHEGELTFAFDGKKSVTLTDLAAKDGKALSSLAMDAMMNGLGGILSAATEAMPDEVGTLLTLFGLNGAAA